MKSCRLVYVLLAICFIIPGIAWAADQTMPPDAEKEGYMAKLDARYQKAVALKEKGDYEASIDMLQKLVDDTQGSARYEIARLDAVLEQSLDMKETGKAEWKNRLKEVGHRLKVMLPSNQGNGDYWVVYAKYSWLVEANNEKHITKALKKAFYYKPNNPEAYIVEADYYSDKAINTRADNKQNSMLQGMGTNTEGDRFALAKVAKSSYESALSGKLSDDRKAYVYYRMGSLEERVFGEDSLAKKDWDTAIKLSADSRTAQLAKKRLERQR